MGSSYTLLVGYAREAQNLRDPEPIKHTLEAFTRLGYWLEDHYRSIRLPDGIITVCHSLKKRVTMKPFHSMEIAH